MTKHFSIIILISLLFHLLISNTRLIFWAANFETVNDLIENIANAIFAFCYSAATIYVIAQNKIFEKRSNDFLLKFCFAIFDGLVIFLWYNTLIEETKRIEYVSILYSFFTILVTLGVGFVRQKTKKVNNSSKYEIDKLNSLIKVKNNQLIELTEKYNELQKVTNSNKYNDKECQIYKIAYYYYIKGRFNKTKDGNRKQIAQIIETYLQENDYINFDFDTWTLEHFKDKNIIQ